MRTLVYRVVERGDGGYNSGETSRMTLSCRRDMGGRGACSSNGGPSISCPQSEPMDISSSSGAFEGPGRLVCSGGRDMGLDAGTNWVSSNWRCFGSERFRCIRKWLYVSCRDFVEEKQPSFTQSKASVSLFQTRISPLKVILGQCMSFDVSEFLWTGRH